MMMDHSGPMMWGMGLLGALVIVVLLLAVAALIKYLLGDKRRQKRREKPVRRRDLLDRGEAHLLHETILQRQVRTLDPALGLAAAGAQDFCGFRRCRPGIPN